MTMSRARDATWRPEKTLVFLILAPPQPPWMIIDLSSCLWLMNSPTTYTTTDDHVMVEHPMGTVNNIAVLCLLAGLLAP